MDYNALAELLFPESTLTREDIEARYPERDLPEGAFVTRIGRARRDSSTSETSTTL